MKKKICQISSVDFTINKFLLPLIDELINQKWDVTIICSEGPYVKKLKSKNYNIKTISISRNLNLFKHFISFIRLYVFLKKNKFDVVHVHTPVASVLGRIAAKLAGVKYVIYTAHGFYFHENMSFLKFKFYFYIEKLFSNFTNLIFTQSKEDQLTCIKYKLCNPKKIICIGNGVSKTKFDYKLKNNKFKIRNQFNIPKEYTTFIFVGRLVKEKGLEYMFNSAFKIIDKNKKIFFLIVGERLESDHSPGIDNYIRIAKKNYKKNIKFLGMRDDIENLLAASDIFCLPSLREGLPRSIIEAMIMGLPVITTNIRGCRELIKNNINGIICSPGSSSSLYDAFNKFILNKDMINKYGLNNYRYSVKRFDESLVVKNQIKLINNLMLNA